VFHHRDHAQPTQCTAETQLTHRKIHEPSSSTRAQLDPATRETTAHTSSCIAACRKTQEEQALTSCTARRRAKSISSTHIQRAQNIVTMHFAIQPLRSPRSATQNARSSPHAIQPVYDPPPQRNATRTQQPIYNFCVQLPQSCTTQTKHSRNTLNTQKDT
jgi:hypothetical protein